MSTPSGLDEEDGLVEVLHVGCVLLGRVVAEHVVESLEPDEAGDLKVVTKGAFGSKGYDQSDHLGGFGTLELKTK